MPHFWNGMCNLLKANKIFFFQNLSIHPFASLYSDPADGRGITMFAANIRDTIDEVTYTDILSTKILIYHIHVYWYFEHQDIHFLT
jgi:hypothetical protein